MREYMRVYNAKRAHPKILLSAEEKKARQVARANKYYKQNKEQLSKKRQARRWVANITKTREKLKQLEASKPPDAPEIAHQKGEILRLQNKAGHFEFLNKIEKIVHLIQKEEEETAHMAQL